MSKHINGNENNCTSGGGTPSGIGAQAQGVVSVLTKSTDINKVLHGIYGGR